MGIEAPDQVARKHGRSISGANQKAEMDLPAASYLKGTNLDTRIAAKMQLAGVRNSVHDREANFRECAEYSAYSGRLRLPFLGDMEREGGGPEFTVEDGRVGGERLFIPRRRRDEAQRAERTGKEKAKPAPYQNLGCGTQQEAVVLPSAGAGRAGGLAAPAHGLGARRDACGDFRVSGLFAGLILGFLAMEHGFLVLRGFLRLGSGWGLVFVVTVKGPAGTCGRGNWTESGESECEASSQEEFLHCKHLNWTISNIWSGERLLYRRTVFHGENRAERHGRGWENSGYRRESVDEVAARLRSQALQTKE